MNEKILVSDMHIGVGLAQTGTLQSLSAGANPVSPRLFSFSGHAGLAKHSTLYSDPNEDEAKVAAHVKGLFGKNAIIWDSEEDLLDKLTETDLEQVRRKMYEENQRKREAVLKQWQSLVFPQEGR